jgi:hypothetical protein
MNNIFVEQQANVNTKLHIRVNTLFTAWLLMNIVWTSVFVGISLWAVEG